MFPDHLYGQLAKFDFLEVLTEEQYQNFNNPEKEKKAQDVKEKIDNNPNVDELVNAHWKSAEKEIKSNKDVLFLEAALPKAKELGKNKITEMLEERIKELKG